MDAAYKAGCKRFDGAIKGFGGCPMAKDDLTGNMPMEKLISYFTTQKASTGVRTMSFEAAYNEALKVFYEKSFWVFIRTCFFNKLLQFR